VKLATWNVNSLNVRLPRLLGWLAAEQPDVVCLQETKLEDAKFPRLELEAAGYAVFFSGQRTYNGVALSRGRARATFVTSSRHCPDSTTRRNGRRRDRRRQRVIGFYVPNAVDRFDKYLQARLAARRRRARRARAESAPAICGDFVCARGSTCTIPDSGRGQVRFDPERAVFRGWIALGLADAFRLFPQPEKTFSWWDYRQLAFPKNHGLRIDHILLSSTLAAKCTACRIDRNARKGQKPSDHAPVIAEFAP
jgi:exodeoxyribonuclease-3